MPDPTCNAIGCRQPRAPGKSLCWRCYDELNALAEYRQEPGLLALLWEWLSGRMGV